MNDLIEAHYTHLDTGYIDELRVFVKQQTNKRMEDIEERDRRHKKRIYFDTYDELMGDVDIADERIFIGYVEILSDKLSIIALYRLIEDKHKDILNVITGKEKSRYSFWKHVKKDFPKIKKLKYYHVINELRALNNAIKHEDCVSSELRELTDAYGNIGDELINVGDHYERLRNGAKEYVKELYVVASKTKGFEDAYGIA